MQVSEPLNGITSLAGQLDTVITTPGHGQEAVINISGQLKKTVNITPFSQDPLWGESNDEFAGISHNTSDDIIYGGLGNDWLHGNSGDDAISGAEALPRVAAQLADGTIVVSGFDTPVNLGGLLAFSPSDADGRHSNRANSGEFALYDEYNPLKKITLAKNGETLEFLLNFSDIEGPTLPGGTTSSGSVNSDGDDRIFGDLGNDWIVGGTGRDNLYGGFGNDLLQADDKLGTAGGANTAPDTDSSYEDRAYGGAGRDVLIANTGGDRLIDWVGEFNSFIVPFAPFGRATVSRTLQPQLPEFLNALSLSDGADPTRAADTGADPARNGEPFGEIGMVRQQDSAWHDQTGGPSDPQAGNLPGGKRDVLRSASFDDGTLSGFVADSGNWAVVNGALQVAAQSQGGDAAAVVQIDAALTASFDVTASVSVLKPTGGWKGNAYLIFDYFSKTDFKFAGLDVSNNKLVMGRRTASGWIVDRQTPFQSKSDTIYDMTLSVNGLVATLSVGAKSVTQSYAGRVIGGKSYGLNWGFVGLGSDNSRGSFDNVLVRRAQLPSTFQYTEEFLSSPDKIFNGARTGNWSASGGRYISIPSSGPNFGLNLMDLGAGNLEPSSQLDLTSKTKNIRPSGFRFRLYLGQRV